MILENINIYLKKNHDKRVKSSHPWVYSNEIEKIVPASPEAGSLAKFFAFDGSFLGCGYYNKHSLIAGRILSFKNGVKIDADFFIEKIKAAFSWRSQIFEAPFYRLIHAEGDGLAGLVIDRFDNIFVCQITTAGMEKMSEFIIAALKFLFVNPVIIFRNDTASRQLEGLPSEVKIVEGNLEQENIVIENGLKFYFDPINGQKTGWFFDQRENRKSVAQLALNKDVLDVYCYNGGFGINCAKNQAKSVTFIDSSAPALEKVKENVSLNDIKIPCNYLASSAFDELEKLQNLGKKFGLVMLDPPAFIKSKKDFFSGVKGYEKLVKLGAALVEDGGFLFLASCSHNINLEELISASILGIRKAGREGRIIRKGGAGYDHPINACLNENEYLKSVTYQLV